MAGHRQEYRRELVITTVGVVAGRVLAVNRHPNADLIRLATVDLGRGDAVQIVFGGPPIVSPGSLVPAAVPGSRLRPGGRKMRRRNYRGQSSYGMLCSLAELGWDPVGPDEVALLRDVRPGDSLDGYAWDWWTIVVEPVEPVLIPAPTLTLPQMVPTPV